MIQEPLFKTLDGEAFETAEEFLDKLRPTNKRWMQSNSKWGCDWIFRGQENVEWTLIPRAWRINELQRLKSEYSNRLERELPPRVKAYFEDNWDKHRSLIIQLLAEKVAIQEFVEVADRVGHPVLNIDSFSWVNDFFESFISSDWSDHFPPYHVALLGGDLTSPIYALAQHHGIPTRLIDWTENPLIAAFFAAEAVSPQDTTGRIAVWAIHRKLLNRPNNRIRSIRVPRSMISYLHAQSGVFTFDPEANRCFLKEGKWNSIEDVIENDETDFLHKLTLPKSEVGELLKLLWIEGISLAHLMPTYDNVTKAIELRSRWQIG